MVLFTILAIILLILIAVVVLVISITGAAGILVFGDVIVCMVIIGAIMYAIIKKKKEK